MRIGTALILLLDAAPLAAQTRTLDDFATISNWTAAPSDGVGLDLSQDQGALRLDFDFHGGAGYAVAHKALDLDLPANWEISFRIRGEAPVNNLELKLIDPSGQNVWWINRKNFQIPRDWREVRTKKRQIEFAWGPVGGGEMKKVAAIEFAITAGTGGKGTVWIDDLKFTRAAARPSIRSQARRHHHRRFDHLRLPGAPRIRRSGDRLGPGRLLHGRNLGRRERPGR